MTKEQEDQYYMELYNSPEMQAVLDREYMDWIEAHEAEHDAIQNPEFGYMTTLPLNTPA